MKRTTTASPDQKETKMKKENAKAEDEKQLVWKLAEKPSGHVVAELVAQGVITKEEARSILFREEVKQSDEVVALKELVNTLSEMVQELMNRPRDVQFVPYTKVIEVPRRHQPYWINAVGNTSGITMSSTSGTSGNTTYTLSASN
jgi:polyhydroxyalkanoate synthesis regulator phasin